MSQERDRIRRIRDGLVGDDVERARLYRTSATFRAEIDTLAQLLPAWADGLAEKAREADLQIEQAMAQAMNDVGRPFAVARPK